MRGLLQAWALCRVLTTTDRFENAGAWSATIDEIVDDIREKYPQWAFMKTCSDRVAERLNTSIP